LPEARARVRTDPLVFCLTTERAENQFYFWPSYPGRLSGQNAIFVRELKMPGMLPGWHWNWLRGETNLSEPLPAGEPAPDRLRQQFESVTDLGVKEVLYRGRTFHLLQLFECRNLR